LCAWLSETQHSIIFPIGLGAMALFMTALLFLQGNTSGGIGLTTSAMALLTYILGGLVFWNYWKIALALAVVSLIMLTGKRRIHEVSRRITQEDVRLTLQFLALTGVILPLVPDRAMGPFDAFNPRSTWMMVVLVSGLGFAGYLAIRLMGSTRGITLTGIFGGLASSTATTLAMSRQSKTTPNLAPQYALAVILACTVMIWRVLVLLFTINSTFSARIWFLLILVSLPGAIYGAVLYFCERSHKSEENSGTYTNPLSLSISLKFAALYAIIVFLVKAANHYLGTSGIYAVSAISGLTDLDAISLSLAESVNNNGLGIREATIGVLIAIAANTVLKTVLVYFQAAPAMRKRMFLFAATTILSSTIAALWVAWQWQ
ncbi:MAG TPA: DUF4010 domain-containing protein, partial [Oculatellaceae cyanobacterium]